MAMDCFSPGLSWWKVKICPSRDDPGLLAPGRSQEKRSKVSGNSNLKVHKCIGEAGFNSVSLRISLDGNNCDGPSAQDHSKGTHAQGIFWAVALTGL